MNSTLLDTYGASDRLLFSENDYRNPSNSKVISALQELMCDKDFCTLYSLFVLALARKELSACSFRLFIGEKPLLPQTIEDLSTEVTEDELNEAFIDEWGVKYSKDGRKLLKAPQGLKGNYSVKVGTRIICDDAFSKCSSLTSIVISNSVVSIGDGAFKFSSLSNIVIPDSMTSIGSGAFWGCCSLSNVVVPDSVTSIGNGAFRSCSSLSNVIIPNSVTSIGNGTFYGCRSLSNIGIPSCVTNIANFLFCGCRSLSDIVIPDSVTSIGIGAFSNCRFLSNIVIPDSVTNIRRGAFYKCNLPYRLEQNLISHFGNELFKFPLQIPGYKS